MGLFWERKVLLAKTEVTYGTDSAPTGAANAILATNVSLSPMEGSDLSRELERPFLGAQETVPVDLHAKLSFRVELQASGTAGTAPAWGPLMLGCAMAQTISAGVSVTYNPVSSGHPSLTIHLNIDGINYVLLGARGTCKITIGASGIPYAEFTFWGLFTQPAAVALPTAVLTAFQRPLAATRVNTPTFTVNSVALILRTFSLDFGNEVEPRFLIGPQSGSNLSEEIIIPARAEKVEMTIEQPTLATFNPFSLAAAGTLVPLVLQHGTVAGRRCTVNIPQLQLMRPTSLENRQKIVELPLSGMPILNAGNDQFTLVLT